MIGFFGTLIVAGIAFFLIWRNNKKHFEQIDQIATPLIEKIKELEGKLEEKLEGE